MDEIPSPVPGAALVWLRFFFFERFGVEFDLKVCKSYTRLGLPGDPHYIEFSNGWAVFSKVTSDLPCSSWDASAEGWITPLHQPLPAIGASALVCPLVERIETGYRVHYDVLSMIVWVLSRREEVCAHSLDEHGRFPARASHAFRHNYLDRPVVDEWVEIVRQLIKRVWPRLALTRFQFSVSVSHDVDHPAHYGFLSFSGTVRAASKVLITSRNLLEAMRVPFTRLGTQHSLHPRDPANTFKWIMNASEARSLTSAFYFICGRTDPIRDAAYDPEHPAIRTLMREIHSRGHEIGVHPSYGTHLAPNLIATEARRLRKIASEENISQARWGGRMHYLRWKQPITLRAWEAAGLDYDTTLGYADMPGFRCGTCFEYPALDPLNFRLLRLRLRPLIAMERTVIASHYMSLGISDAALSKFISLKSTCKAVGGLFTLLWHNSELTDPASRRLYLDVLDS